MMTSADLPVEDHYAMDDTETPRVRPLTVAIVGAGMSGVLMGIRLKEAGLETFSIYEKADKLGGTWRDNTYPGIACDVAARSYVYEFAPNPNWTRLLAGGGEIQRYFEDVAQRYDVGRHIVYNREVTNAEWRDGRWSLTFASGDTDVADVLITATGALHHPKLPDIPGLADFAGAAFHTARWDHSVPLDGRRVGLIGTGATGAQVTAALAGVAQPLTVFQRSPQWIFPLPNWKISSVLRNAYRRSGWLNRFGYRMWRRVYDVTFSTATVEPGLARTVMQAMCRLHLRTVRDRELRRKLTPTGEPMCRRLVMTTRYYPALKRERMLRQPDLDEFDLTPYVMNARDEVIDKQARH